MTEATAGRGAQATELEARGVTPSRLGAETAPAPTSPSGAESAPVPAFPLVMALLLAVYFIAGKLGLRLAFLNASATAVWPPTGIALWALLVLGYRMWPIVLIGAFLVNATTAGTLLSSAGIAVGNTLEALVGAWLVNRFAGGRHAFERARGIFGFAALAGLFSTAISATVGVLTLAFAGFAPWTQFGPVWLTWWLGDAGGALVLAPLLLLWSANPRPGWTPSQRPEAVLLLLAVVVSGVVVFGGLLPSRAGNFPLDFLALPVLLWAAFRFGPREATAAVVLSAGIAIYGSLRGMGPFGAYPPNQSLVLLQVFLCVVAVTTAALAAVVAQRREVGAALRRAYDDLGLRFMQQSDDLARAVDALSAQLHERGAVESKVRESELQLAQAQELAHLGSWSWDIASDQVRWSDELFRIYGLEPGSRALTFKGFLALVHPDDRERVERTVERSRSSGESFSFDHRIQRPDGRVRWVHGRGEVVLSSGPVRMYGTAQDITERVESERQIQLLNASLERRVEERTAELRRSNEELRQFASVAAHDLQEPLRTVTTYTQLLARRYKGRLDKDADEFIHFAADAAEWMHALIDGLLAYSRAGIDEIRLEPVDCAGLVERAVANLRTTVKERRAAVQWGGLPVVAGDRAQLSQLFQNLIANAIKFCRDVPQVHVSARREESAWRFAIRDNGIGIDPKHLERIFSLFQRLHGRDEYPGTGIGLAVCRRIVERHGGRIWAESRPGHGSTFYFTLSGAAAESSQPRSEEAA